MLNGEKLYTDAPAELTSNSTMVGARFVSEMLGCDVEWLSEKRIVSIMTPGFESTGALSEKKEPEKEENLTSSEKYKDASEVLLMHRKLPKLYYDIGVVKDGELDGKDINTLVDFSEQKENYYLRTKLPNLSHKLSNQQDRTLNVVFFGSDDTQNGAFVSYISNCMTELFGNRFSFSVECRNGDTSADGADRAAQAMAQHEPDLVFIEFAKGDAAQTAEVSARSMESIIRRIYELNDTTEVVFLYTGEEWSTGARVHDYVAAHYGIPAVFVSNADIGANIDAFFNDMFVNDVAGLSAYDYMSPAYLYKEAAAERESFELGAYIDGAGFSEQKDGSGNTEYLSGTAGDGVSFTFVGIQAGVYVLAESGYIDIYVDGELYKTVSVSDTSTAVKTAVLENGTHTVSFKVSEKTAEENGKITFKSGFAAGILEK